MKKYRIVEIVLILLICTVLSIMIPAYMANMQDKDIVDTVVTENIPSLYISRTDQMERCTLLEKCAFVLDEKVEFLEYVPVVGGRRLEPQEAADDASYEMEILSETGMFTNSGFVPLGEGKVYTAANSDNPSQSLVVWKFWMMDDVGEQYAVILDDSTGKIIDVKVLSLEISIDKTAPGYEKIANAWSEYLGAASMLASRISYEKVDVQKTIDSFGDMGLYVLESSGLDIATLERRYGNLQAGGAGQGVTVNICYKTQQDIQIDLELYRNFLSYGFRQAK